MASRRRRKLSSASARGAFVLLFAAIRDYCSAMNAPGTSHRGRAHLNRHWRWKIGAAFDAVDDAG